MAIGFGGLVAIQPSLAADKVNFVLDWSWVAYHSAFLLAQERGYYKDVDIDLNLEQGRGSASSALLVGQGSFDIAHINITNAAQAGAKGMPIRTVALYQHGTSSAFIGIKGKVKLDGPQSLIGLKIGSTPGGSDGFAMAIFREANKIPENKLDIVALDANVKTVALLNGQVDVVSGDSHAYNAIVRGAGKEPEMLQFSKYGVPLLGFGFAANDKYFQSHKDVVKRFLAASKKGFAEAQKDPDGACDLIQKDGKLPGSHMQCVLYMTGLFDLSTPATDANWGRMTEKEWIDLLATLKSVGQIEKERPVADYYSNDAVP